jgi:hypothetical protein
MKYEVITARAVGACELHLEHELRTILQVRVFEKLFHRALTIP